MTDLGRYGIPLLRAPRALSSLALSVLDAPLGSLLAGVLSDPWGVSCCFVTPPPETKVVRRIGRAQLAKIPQPERAIFLPGWTEPDDGESADCPLEGASPLGDDVHYWTPPYRHLPDERTSGLTPIERFLWSLLDDVSTASDVAKGDDARFREMALACASRREEAPIVSNGYRLKLAPCKTHHHHGCGHEDYPAPAGSDVIGPMIEVESDSPLNYGEKVRYTLRRSRGAASDGRPYDSTTIIRKGTDGEKHYGVEVDTVALLAFCRKVDGEASPAAEPRPSTPAPEKTVEEIAVDTAVNLGLGYLEGRALERLVVSSVVKTPEVRALALRSAAEDLIRAAERIERDA
jgi:hypothetical protein